MDAPSRVRSDGLAAVFRQIGNKPENGELKGPRGLDCPQRDMTTFWLTE